MTDLKPLCCESKWIASIQRVSAVAALALFAVSNVLSQDAAPAESQPEKDEPQVSSFTVPQTLNEGRDPFYPNATWFIATLQRDTEQKSDGPIQLELKGVSGTPQNPLAIINNRTLAIGEEQDVTTPQGKVRVKCLDIDGTTVRIYAQGRMQELMLRRNL